ncbi:conserved Plasmodium protein, unknown function [Plasmodium chabaudi chabaudi]|uniref:Transmembrane protein n=1 Tax=Plasmodium chabaudi chabaudi TaxID=31271 RepID=A0A1D3RU86_PLACU|nr:conserved Plasmodium protein, unknown function [Plasmodium chabaudi chabaudi]
MEETNPKFMRVFISIAFYSFYILYLFMYAYETICIFYKKTSFVLICATFICTYFSVAFVSYSLLIFSCFFVIVIASIEISKFTHPGQIYFGDPGFHRFFLITRLFGTFLFIIFYALHITNLKKAQLEQLHNGNVENATTPASISRTILTEHNIQPSNFNNSNNPDIQRNYMNRTIVDIEKDNTDFIDQKNKEAIEAYSLNKKTFPTINKDDIQSISMKSNQGSINKFNPFSHYKVTASEYLNNPRTAKLKMNNPGMNDAKMNDVEMNDAEMNDVLTSMNKNVIENNPGFPTNHILYNNGMGNNRK